MGVRPSPATRGPELEILAFAAGLKPALRLCVSAGRAPSAIARWEAKGLAVARTEAGRQIRLYVARSAQLAHDLRATEARVPPGGAPRAPDAAVLEAHRALGRGLGYPPCCVEGYLERLARGVEVRRDGSRAAERVVAAEAALARSTERWGRLSFLLPRRRALVPFDPCAFDCDLAGRYATALFEVYRARRPGEAARMREALVRPVRLDARGRALDPRDPEPSAITVRFDRF